MRRAFFLLCVLVFLAPWRVEAACTNTSNISLCKLTFGDTTWHTNTNANWDIVDQQFDNITGHNHNGVNSRLMGVKSVNCASGVSLNTCVSGLTDPTTVYINESLTYTSAPTISSVLTLVFGGTGKITCTASTITVNSDIRSWTGAAIFDTATCAGKVSFASNTRIATYDPEWFGAKPNDGVSDDAAVTAISTAVQSLNAGTPVIRFGKKGTYALSTQLLITVKNVVIEGIENRGRQADNGVRLEFSGAATSLFELGTDDGNAYDTGSYNGVQGFTLRNLNIVCTASGQTALINGLGNYCANKAAVRDWRGGGLRIQNVIFENWHWAVWGIQSDINFIEYVTNIRSKEGFYFGPRSDQLFLSQYYALWCDTGLVLDRNDHARILDSQFVETGSSSTVAAYIKSDWASRGSMGARFERVWWEYFGTSTQNIAAFVSIGDGSGAQTKDVYFINNHILNNGADPKPTYFAQINNATRVSVLNPSFYVQTTTLQMGGLVRLLNFIGSAATPQAHVTLQYDQYKPEEFGAIYANNGTGTPAVQVDITGGAHREFRMNNGRLYVGFSPPDPDKDFYLSTGSLNRTFQVTFPQDGTGNTNRIKLTRRVVYVTGIPSSTSPYNGLQWGQGDIAILETATAGAAAMWICTAGGTPGTWKVLASAAA